MLLSKLLVTYALVIGFPEGGGGGGPRADMGTLLIVYFKVLVFPHPCGICFLQSPQYLANPTGHFEDALQNFIWVL